MKVAHVKKTKAAELHLTFRIVQQLKISMAGEEGFEPSHAGIKIRCLNRLGYSPTRFTPNHKVDADLVRHKHKLTQAHH